MWTLQRSSAGGLGMTLSQSRSCEGSALAWRIHGIRRCLRVYVLRIVMTADIELRVRLME